MHLSPAAVRVGSSRLTTAPFIRDLTSADRRLFQKVMASPWSWPTTSHVLINVLWGQGTNKALVCNICQFPCCKYSRCGQFLVILQKLTISCLGVQAPATRKMTFKKANERYHRIQDHSLLWPGQDGLPERGRGSFLNWVVNACMPVLLVFRCYRFSFT